MRSGEDDARVDECAATKVASAALVAQAGHVAEAARRRVHAVDDGALWVGVGHAHCAARHRRRWRGCLQLPPRHARRRGGQEQQQHCSPLRRHPCGHLRGECAMRMCVVQAAAAALRSCHRSCTWRQAAGRPLSRTPFCGGAAVPHAGGAGMPREWLGGRAATAGRRRSLQDRVGDASSCGPPGACVPLPRRPAHAVSPQRTHWLCDVARCGMAVSSGVKGTMCQELCERRARCNVREAHEHGAAPAALHLTAQQAPAPPCPSSGLGRASAPVGCAIRSSC